MFLGADVSANLFVQWMWDSRLLVFAIAIAGLSAYLASVVCRAVRSRGRQPGWNVAVLVAASMAALAMPVTAVSLFILAGLVALVPAWLVVAHYRDKADRTDPKL